MKHNKQYYTNKKALIEKYGNLCWYCGIPLELENEAHIDHIIPQSIGGSDDLDNLALSCGMCNRAKFNKDVSVFLKWLGRIRSGHFQCRILDKIKHDLSEIERDWLNKEF
jgi:CRISPR/Cas system Type II protein with McrA/HNH and RuvC-like nuclease domain